MKKFLVLIIAVVSFQFAAQAQTKVAFGGKIGLASSQFKGKEKGLRLGDEQQLNAINAGAFLNISYKYIAVQPEVLFNQKGSKYSILGTESSFKTSYIEIPVLIKAQYPVSIITPNVFAGPYASFKVAEQTKIGSLTIDGEAKENVVDYGMTFGGGVDIFPTSNIMLSLDARYDLGLKDLTNKNGTTTFEVKNSSWIYSLGIGVRF